LSALPRVFSYIRRYPGLAAITLLCAVAGTSLVVVFPAVTQRIIDDAIRGGRPELILPLGLLGLGAFFLQDLLNGLRIVLNNHFEQKVIFDIRSDLYSHIQSLPLKWFDARATGDIMTRLVEDVTSMERVLIDGIEQGTVAVLQIVIVAGIMFFYSPFLAAFALIPIPFLALGAIAYTLTAKNRYRLQRRAASAMNALLHDNLAGIRQIKTFGGETREHARFNAASDVFRNATLVVMRVWAVYNPSMQFLNSLGGLLVVVMGGYLTIDGRMEVGVLVAFLVLVRFLYEPISRLHQLNQLFQSGRAAAERVFEILDEPPEPGRMAFAVCREEEPETFRGGVVFDNVSFSHEGSERTLHHVSLHAEPGQTVALVGPTGAGKSTLVNLLVRFYEVESGRILVDGLEIRELSLDLLRRITGVVTQESFLFNGTVADNLRVGNPQAGEEEMWEALRAANADDFVRRMPSGLATEVGERGVRLSVGEKQRVSIARVLLKNPPILILDEATASVDTKTEKLIQESLDRLMRGRTAFVIAHRLSTIRRADQILVLERGQIIQRGSHESLLQEDGLYQTLWRHMADEEEVATHV